MSRLSAFVAFALVLLSSTPAPARAQAPRDTARVGFRYVYLVRHAIYDGNDPRDERIGKGLDSLGYVQARLTGARFAGLPITIDTFASSTFTRAAQTADVIGEAIHKQPTRDSMLCECTAPSNRPDYMRNLAPGEADTCLARLSRVYARYFRPADGRADQHDVLVAHGNVIRWLTCRALGIDTVRWPEFTIGNGSITAFVIRYDGSVSLAAFSDTGHLPADAQTWTARGAGWSPTRRAAAASGAGTSMQPGGRGVSMPSSPAAFDTLKHTRPTHR